MKSIRRISTFVFHILNTWISWYPGLSAGLFLTLQPSLAKDERWGSWVSRNSGKQNCHTSAVWEVIAEYCDCSTRLQSENAVGFGPQETDQYPRYCTGRGCFGYQENIQPTFALHNSEGPKCFDPSGLLPGPCTYCQGSLSWQVDQNSTALLW